jgi:hypothetical protein
MKRAIIFLVVFTLFVAFLGYSVFDSRRKATNELALKYVNYNDINGDMIFTDDAGGRVVLTFEEQRNVIDIFDKADEITEIYIKEKIENYIERELFTYNDKVYKYYYVFDNKHVKSYISITTNQVKANMERLGVDTKHSLLAYDAFDRTVMVSRITKFTDYFSRYKLDHLRRRSKTEIANQKVEKILENKPVKL